MVNKGVIAGTVAGIDPTMPQGYVPQGYPQPWQQSGGNTTPFQFYPYPYAVPRNSHPPPPPYPPPSYPPSSYPPPSMSRYAPGAGEPARRSGYLSWLIAALVVSGMAAAAGTGAWWYIRRKRRQKMMHSNVANQPLMRFEPEPPGQEFGIVGFVPMIDA